jgi:hypothetical protein
MECPTCDAPAHPDGPDAVISSSDGPLLLTRWQCSRSRSHWWHGTTDVCPLRTRDTGCEPTKWPVSEIATATAFSRAYRSRYLPR